MKKLLQFAIVIACASFVIYLDVLLYDLIISAIPPTAWIKLIKIAIIILMIIYTSTIVIVLTAFASAIALAILEVLLPTRYRPNTRWFKTNTPPKSKFQQRLDAMAEERRQKRLNQ